MSTIKFNHSTLNFLCYLTLLGLVHFKFISCKKASQPPSYKTIKGMVYNTCTDSGLAGVEIFLEIFRNEKYISRTRQLSSSGGYFLFENVPVYLDNDYEYAVHIPSRSGDVARAPGEESFTGCTMYFSGSEADKFLQPPVTPSFLFLCFKANITFPISQPDSLLIILQQPIFHKNVPDFPYTGQISNFSSLESCTSNYPMGWWIVETKKWKKGQFYHYFDSIYLGQGDTKTYNIVW
jgi:hypothetical protein